MMPLQKTLFGKVIEYEEITKDFIKAKRVGNKLVKEQKETKKPEYVSIAGLKGKYKLTGKIIAMLGECDLEVDNPHYKSASQMKLYRIDRVEDFLLKLKQDHPEIIEKMRLRQEKAKGGVNTRRENARKLYEQITANFAVQDFDPATIGDEAEKTHIDFMMFERDKSPDQIDWIPSMKANIAHIRHNYTNYDDVLMTLRGKVGITELYIDFRKKVDELIEKKWDKLGGKNYE